MEFSFIDFLIGFFLMNAMPHTLFGLMRIRFLSIFGFGALANLGYGFVNIVIALILFHIQYGISTLASHGIVIGVGVMWLIYLVSGKYFYKQFHKQTA